jgi:hypothetical protein
MDVTPRTGMNQHANGMHIDLFHPIDEAMKFGETPKTSERPDPLASFNTSPLLKGHTVNFESTSPFRYDGDKDGYPDFNLGTHPVTYNTAPAPVTHQAHTSVPSFDTHQAHSSVLSPATHQAHSSYVQNTSSVPSPATHQAHSVYVQNTSSVPSSTTHQAHPSVLPTVTQQATTSVPYPIRSTNVQNSATYQVHPVTHQVHPVHHQVHPAYVNPAHVHVTSPAYANNPVMTTALPSQNGPPTYQASSPYIIQEPHPYDIRSSGPHMNTPPDYAEALQRGISERSPIAAYRGNGYHVPGYYAMSNASGPYRQNLIPNPHYSITSAVKEYHLMHPNESAADLALQFWSPN